MIVTSFYLFTLVSVGYGISYGYGPDDGPQHWPGTCQDGIRQSPIDIRAHDVNYAMLSHLHFKHYEHLGDILVKNNGHTVVGTNFASWEHHRRPSIHGGGLDHKYDLLQFHFHWSHTESTGSEHKFGGLHYPAELHLVHIQHKMSLEQAARTVDGLAVVAVFFVINDKDNDALQQLEPALEKVITANSTAELTEFRVGAMIPDKKQAFYRYEGSLTTPLCSEAVVWTLLAEPLSITRKQLKAFRSLHDENNIPVSHNYRPTQPLNGRKVLYRPSQYDRKLLMQLTDSQAFSSSISHTFNVMLAIVVVALF